MIISTIVTKIIGSSNQRTIKKLNKVVKQIYFLSKYVVFVKVSTNTLNFNLQLRRKKMTEVGGIAVDRLRSLIERIERLEEEKAGIASDIRDIYAEAKGAGFDVKIMRTIIKLRKMNAADRDEQEILLDTYRKALDM